MLADGSLIAKGLDMRTAYAIDILNHYDCGFCYTDGTPMPAVDIAEAVQMAVEAIELVEKNKQTVGDSEDAYNRGMYDGMLLLREKICSKEYWTINQLIDEWKSKQAKAVGK